MVEWLAILAEKYLICKNIWNEPYWSRVHFQHKRCIRGIYTFLLS